MMRAHRLRRVVAALSVALPGLLISGAPPVGADGDPANGWWSAAFQERPDDPTCVEEGQPGDDHQQLGLRPNQRCKPAAGSMAILGGPDVLYWNALEDTEEIETGIVAEFGVVSLNDQVRRMRLGNPTTWQTSTPGDGGATGDLDPLTPLSSTETWNDGALFCSSLTFLPDGRVLAAGGTAYYHDPALPGGKFGVSELEGLANARVYDPRTNTWQQTGDMNKGRWYPSLVPLADGRAMVASGVKRLVKTAYPDQALEGGDPVDAATDSGRNVVETETFDPATGAWTVNGSAPDDGANPASRSLPLYPRLHLLPNGQVYFNAAGQVFNPDGYAYDEVFWNQAAVYDPAAEAWADLGIPGLDAAPDTIPGFRGSTFSVMLPLTPEDGYRSASFLSAGGIVGVSPGTYFAVSDSRIDTVTLDGEGAPALTSEATGDLTQPRWYGTGVLTPTGEVLVFSGASADEVVGPGTALPVTAPELFDPESKTWTPLEASPEARTYHNTAALLPDGRVLVGGHAPISTLYANNTTLVPGVTSPNEGRNPTFEIFSPPYLAPERGPRPKVALAPPSVSPGSTFEVVLAGSHAADDVSSVMLMRRTAITHLVDGGQRGVELEVVERRGNVLTVAMPPSAAVTPAGPYLLFVNADHGNGPTPSVARELTVAGASPVEQTVSVTATAEAAGRPSVDLSQTDAVPVDAEIAFHEILELRGHDHAGHSHGVPAGHDRSSTPATTAAAAAILVLCVLGVAIRRSARTFR